MRSIAALSALSAFAALSALSVLGCEDGPTQPYSAPPDGARNSWNNGNTPPVVDPAKQGFLTSGSSGTNKQEICSGPDKAKRWAAMVQEPIKPPRGGGGIDLAGDNTWKGLTIEEAEQINCQSENEGDEFGDGSQVNQWGDNGEVWFVYRVSTRKGFTMSFFPGYEGTIEATNEDGSDSWSVPINSQIRRNGQNFNLDWTGNNGQNFIEPADAYFRAMMHTYAPSIKLDPAGVTCFDTGRCVKGSFGDVAYFWIPAVGSAIWIENQNAPQPTPSIPNRIDQDLAKILAFSFTSPLLKLDAEGPISLGGTLGPAAAGDCTLKMGQTYGDFLRDCVQATGDPAVDGEELNKLLGGLQHSTERFSFDVVGIDLNFSDKNLADDNVVRDHDQPDPTDVATEFSIDQQTQGKLVNDRDADGNVDLHGAGAVYQEYARLTRAELLRLSGIKDGDTSKCLFPLKPPANFDPQDFINNLPDYCTGFEGFLTGAAKTGKNDVTNLGLDIAVINPDMARGLKLGHQQVTFCFDANGDLDTGYYYCSAGDTFPTSFAQVKEIFGKGKTANLPTEAQDVRFFFKQWFKAFVKYMKVGDQNPVPDLSTIDIDANNLFFDSVGAGQFEIAEYVDRRFVGVDANNVDPTDLVLTADVRNGIFSNYDFSRETYRGEESIYRAMLEDQSHGVGQEDTALLTNVFGSPVLAAGWVDSTMGKSAYYCATNDDPDNCDGQRPPLDANGNMDLDENGDPRLLHYKGAFGNADTAFRLDSSHLTITQTYDSIQSAMVTIPLHADPYDSTSAELTPLSRLIPWTPKQPGIGFPIPLTGTIERFVEAADLDFSGTTISANVNYEILPPPNDDGSPPTADQKLHVGDTGQIHILAVETTDFLGEVFLCQDPNTLEILGARMYSSVKGLLEWFDNHPGSYDSCGIIIRYSPFGNFVDYITSLQNGVRLGITQGGGFGRVNDVVLFVPNQ